MDQGPGKLGAKTAADVAKAICGMANAEGGVIVVGLDAQKTIDGGDDRIERLSPIPGLPAFARVVGERVSRFTDPTVPGVRILPLVDPTDSDRGILVIFVPPTDVGPFRTARNLTFEASKGKTRDVSERYYLRNGPHTDVVSHALLGMMFGRRPPPALRLLVEVTV